MRRYCWLLLILLVGVPGVAAQDVPTPPVLVVLASAPDTPEARGLLSYADYAAIAGGATGERAWIDAMLALSSGPDYSNFPEQLETQEQLIGISVFDVQQGATWGEPPAQVTLFQGGFIPLVIQTAYGLRDYTAEELAGLTVFCGPEGCDSGQSNNLAAREPGDPFGGDLGRSQPVLLVPLESGYQLLSTPPLEGLEQSAQAATGAIPSLADSTDYQAAVRAITDAGPLRQAHFLSPDAFGPAPTGGEALPPYHLAVLAETDTTDGLLATVTLVYPTLAEAEAAAEVLERRIEGYVTVRTGQPLVEVLRDRGAVFSVVTAEDPETEWGMAQVILRGPEDAALYRLLVQMLFMRDLGWLALP